MQNSLNSDIEIKLVAIEVELDCFSFKLSVHDKVEWVEICKLLTYDLSKADIPIAKKIKESYIK